ncbi:von Willebrand factor type A, putative [Babesia ovata]|uniref:von Willebrand factor type A, putative n=1 Tax=Babesia ovata TaxID=189622 RepID=A0A2H6K9L9_9APIC|nr:von Willebrand factor type A, putative [Babesia ovata]GBE59680.1 von Willebrand factor type A, putative [Babesia ovata]
MTAKRHFLRKKKTIETFRRKIAAIQFADNRLSERVFTEHSLVLLNVLAHLSLDVVLAGGELLLEELEVLVELLQGQLLVDLVLGVEEGLLHSVNVVVDEGNKLLVTVDVDAGTGEALVAANTIPDGDTASHNPVGEEAGGGDNVVPHDAVGVVGLVGQVLVVVDVVNVNNDGLGHLAERLLVLVLRDELELAITAQVVNLGGGKSNLNKGLVAVGVDGDLLDALIVVVTDAVDHGVAPDQVPQLVRADRGVDDGSAGGTAISLLLDHPVALGGRGEVQDHVTGLTVLLEGVLNNGLETAYGRQAENAGNDCGRNGYHCA